MSPNINSFVGDLVAMAQAMEELPKAQDRIADLERQLNDALTNVQDREVSIIGYKEQIDTLRANLRAANDQRDDIELKMLEMEDKNNAVSRFLGTFMSDANSLRNVIDPPKPIEVAQSPVEDHTPSSGDASADVSQAVTGQSEAGPSAQHHDTPPIAPSPLATSGDAGSTTTEHSGDSHSEVSANPEPSWAGEAKPVEADPTQRFASMMYENYAHWVPRSEWIAGGGTDYSYDYRSAHTNHSF